MYPQRTIGWRSVLYAWFLLAALLPASISMAGDASGRQRIYVLLFEEEPLATYAGTIPGLKATNPRSQGRRRLDPASPASRAYLAYLERRQNERLAAVRSRLGRRPEVVFRYRAAGNGVALRLNPAEAASVAAVPGVVRVIEDYNELLDTDRGPQFIGADGIWDGSTTGGGASRGEGVLVGIIDSGINMTHPSFSDVPLDGHVYTNPFGQGVHVGWCDPADPNYLPTFVCNDKLVGAWDFIDAVSVDNDGPEDSDGHGSHTASTVAGNAVDYNGDGVADLSGVAPHANLIMYDACYVDPSSGLGLCPFSATSAAVDQAIFDEVDVINYSISGGTSPWTDIDSNFLEAVAVGVFVAASAGNNGPGAGSVAHRGPWVTAVAASTHDRTQHDNSLVNLSGGVTSPADITGRSLTLGYGPASIVYAGDFDNGDQSPEQCLTPFPAGTWSGEIVLCDRGAISRVMKGQNVLMGGAGGLVLANVLGGNTNIVADAHVLPAVHVDLTDGDTLRDWLGLGGGHTATITASTPIFDPAAADIVASFSSRGPNTSFDVLKPDVANPGVNILAAYARGPFETQGLPPYMGVQFSFLSGTSMSSPHTAGSAALLRGLHPTWTPLQIKSALMTTAQTGLFKQDGVTPADPHDIGAGRVDLSRAGRAGLLFDETHAAFVAANPASAGDPATLNLPSMMDSICPLTCSWTRTVENPLSTSVSWTVSTSGPAWMTIDVSPSNFVLAPGASQILTIDVSGAQGGPIGVWAFGEVALTPDDPTVPDAHMPLAIRPTGVPQLEIQATRVDDTLGNLDGYADPEEIITLEIDLQNTGTGDSTGISGVLSTTTPGITLLDDSAVWPTLPTFVVGTSLAPHLKFQIDGSVACGSMIDFNLDLTTDQGPFNLAFQQPVGFNPGPGGVYSSVGLPHPIPDNDLGGIFWTINVPETFDILDINVSVDIAHPAIGDLEVYLTSPSATIVQLHDRSGGGMSNIVTTYDTLTVPDGPGGMTDFDGEPATGIWTLLAIDAQSNNVGKINSWTLTIDGTGLPVCAPVPCLVLADAVATPDTICAGESAMISGAGSSEIGTDCGGTLEYRFSDSGVLQDWSLDPDVAVSPSMSTNYTVEARDTGTLAVGSAADVVNVLPSPMPSIGQAPEPMCVELGSVDLDAGPGFVSYTWTDDTMVVVGTSQVLPLGLAACGRTYAATVTGVNSCASAAAHVVDCIPCTPPEVSAASSTVPFRIGVDALESIEFELLPDNDVVYHLYSADTIAEILAGDWTNKICDLASGVSGTWTPIGPDTVRWTPPFPGALFQGNWVVVAERFGVEGSYGPRPADLDGLGSNISINCP